ncbi:MAG: hypothetical protein ACM3QX_11110 [Syntrophomonadaceae bacterium]
MKKEEKEKKQAEEKEKKPPFVSKRVNRSYIQKINSTPDKIFPLLCPRRELDWLDGWHYEMIYSESGFAEDGAVFKTKHEGEVNTIWTVTRYDKENFEIEFVRMTWEVVVVRIKMRLEDNRDGSSNLHIEYIFTPITEKGNEFIDGKSAKQFLEMMKWWEKSLNYYLETGGKLLALKL